uniref:Uncharacterized protein n=1 Tax=Timema genevievae TaxID=629358 RepID=A0A7R9K6F6_TIMGE|nr:unnamed protein product [Timema genevievae]
MANEAEIVVQIPVGYSFLYANNSNHSDIEPLAPLLVAISNQSTFSILPLSIFFFRYCPRQPVGSVELLGLCLRGAVNMTLVIAKGGVKVLRKHLKGTRGEEGQKNAYVRQRKTGITEGGRIASGLDFEQLWAEMMLTRVPRPTTITRLVHTEFYSEVKTETPLKMGSVTHLYEVTKAYVDWPSRLT